MSLPCRRLFASLVVALALPLGLAACSDEQAPAPATPPPKPPAAARVTDDDDIPLPAPPEGRAALLAHARRDRAIRRDVSDGGGRAQLEGEAVARSGEPGAFEVVYRVGEHGIATGGGVLLRVEPYWGWTKPQVDARDEPGFVIVDSSATDARLGVKTSNLNAVSILNAGRPLVEGERITIRYGSAVPRIATPTAHLWIAVDGDGDGAHSYLPDSPTVDVRPGPATQLIVTVPPTARPGEEVDVVVAALDRHRNAVTEWTGEVTFESDGLTVPERVAIVGGRTRVRGVAGAVPGVAGVRIRSDDGKQARSNPMEVSPDEPRILFGDLHGHSGLSDGAGTPDDYYRYARDVAGLQLAALTDHDYWGVLPLDQHPEAWAQIQAATRRAHAPESFVTLLGYEWTNWVHGHRHVLYFDDEGPLFSSIDPAYDTPPRLWAALRGRRVMTLAHHSAGGPVPTDWSFAPDPQLEPLTEIASIHGSSESRDTPRLIGNRKPGNYVRDALARGYRLGFIGSGDDHAGHPGSVRIERPPGGLAAILSETLTREGVYEALRARRTYATNGPRIVLRATLGPHAMGAIVPVAKGATVSEDVVVRVIAGEPLRRVDLVRSGAVLPMRDPEGAREYELRHRVEDLKDGEYLYVRAIQTNGGAAWSSPWYFGAVP